MKSEWQEQGSNECGAICLAMLANVSPQIARVWLYGDKGIGRCGRARIVEAIIKYTDLRPLTEEPERLGRKLRLTNLEHDALVYARALTVKEGEVEDDSHHWVVWDHKAQTIRDPLGFTHPLRLTSVTQFVKRV